MTRRHHRPVSVHFSLIPGKAEHLFLFLILMILLCSPGVNGAGETDTLVIGGFSAGGDADSLARLGVPVPLEEGGFQTIYNPGEKIYIRFSKDYEGPKKWRIRTIRLSHRDQFFEKTRLNNQLLITNVSLKNLSTAGGIKLGSGQKEVLDKYGPPTHKKSSGSLIQWIYLRRTGNNEHYFSFTFNKGKVTAIDTGKRATN